MADLSEAREILPDRLYWVCLRSTPQDTPDSHFFITDDLLIYDPYYGDFGPLNLAQLYRYCMMLNDKLKDPALEGKRIYHYCKPNSDTRANSCNLICSWLVIYRGKTPQEAYKPFIGIKPPFVPYRDPSLGPPSFHCTIPHCLQACLTAMRLGWLDFETFDCEAYEYYERVENGDFNWIVPDKFLAFSGPTQTPISYVDGVKTNTPETYFDYFKKNHVTAVIRFNNKVYDRNKFLNAGINHYDMYFADGGNPTDAIIKRFMEVCEAEPGALAVHCKAGLGRTGTLIALYLMKHYGCNAAELIAWLRICRPGSVIGPQQNFLCEKEKAMWREGELHRKKLAAQQQASSSPAPASPSSPPGGVNSVSSHIKNLTVGSGKSPSSPTRSSGRGFAGAAAAMAGPRSPTRTSASTGPSSPVKKSSFPGSISSRNYR